MLGDWGKKHQVLDIYPVYSTFSIDFYDAKLRQPGTPIRIVVDHQGGNTRGFAYCSRLSYTLPNKKDSRTNHDAVEYFIPGFNQRPTVYFFGDKKIEMETHGRDRLRAPPPFYERDEYIWKYGGYM